MSEKIKVGLLGGTGLVGQRLAVLLENHPMFEVTAVAASKNSAGNTYEEAVKNRWKLKAPIPEKIKNIIVKDVHQIDEISKEVDMVFCAVKMKTDELKLLEESYAKAEIPVISNNSAHRGTSDIPMIIPEINPQHLEVIAQQKLRLGTKKGFIVTKPNCSIQSYVPAINALLSYKPTKILVCTYQAVSGSGRTLAEFPEITDNVIPYIGGEEEKSEKEPLKIWGHLEGGSIVPVQSPIITSQCLRVPVSDGHIAAVYVSFENKPSKEEMIKLWREYKGVPQELNLPTAPEHFLTYFDEADRPQPALDRDIEKGMGVSIGRLREDSLFDYKFVSLSHNALRGAAGGSVLTAELLTAKGYIK